MPVKPCRWPGCRELIPGQGAQAAKDRGYCPRHRVKVEEGLGRRGRRADPRYNTKRWKVRSRSFLTRHPLCACGCGRLATDVDHVEAVEDGGDFWAESNWQGLAHECHSRKTADEVRRRTFA
jgi:5-methylcytosine-specific restriction endonuclease McrA